MNDTFIRREVKVSEVWHEYVHSLCNYCEIKRWISYYRSREIRFHNSPPKLKFGNSFPDMSIMYEHLCVSSCNKQYSERLFLLQTEHVSDFIQAWSFWKRKPKQMSTSCQKQTQVCNRNCMTRVIFGFDNIDNIHFQQTHIDASK